jgi:hypothetical protein
LRDASEFRAKYLELLVAENPEDYRNDKAAAAATDSRSCHRVDTKAGKFAASCLHGRIGIPRLTVTRVVEFKEFLQESENVFNCGGSDAGAACQCAAGVSQSAGSGWSTDCGRL